MMIFMGDGDMWAGDRFTVICYLLHSLVIKRLYLKYKSFSKL